MFDDDFTKQKIIRSENPYDMKWLGWNIKNFLQQKCKRGAKQVGLTTHRCKFAQNPELKQFLFRTGKKKLVECTTDQFWGTGVGLNDLNAINPTRWSGDGIMSEILLIVHEEIKTWT